MRDTDKQRGPKFRRRAEARPDEVLDAALDLFIEQGFAATRVEDIARRAGLSKGTVYLYFPSKQALMEALVRRAVLPIADAALGNFKAYDGDPRVVISATLRMLVGRLGDPRLIAIPKLIVREVVNFPELAEMYRREVLERIIPIVVGRIEWGVEHGYFRPVDPELTIRSIIGPILLHVLMAEVFGLTPADGLALDRLVENHLTILFDGLSTGKEAAQ
jgi:AcrR family transcriptional regulator